MDDRLDLIVSQDLLDERAVSQVSFNQGSPAHGPAVPFAEIIQHHRLMTSGREDLRRVAANVARPARDEDPHQRLCR